MKIDRIDTRLYVVPLHEVLSDAMHGSHTHFELIIVEVLSKSGEIGMGYTYTGGRGGHAIQSLINYELAPLLVGSDGSDIEKIFKQMETHIHYVGRGGIAAFAISAIDIALWDLKGKNLNKSLIQMLGAKGNTSKAYCGGIDLNFPIKKLLNNVEGYLNSGFNAIKIKVGRKKLTEDIERVRRIRKLIGPNIIFMVGKSICLGPKLWGIYHSTSTEIKF